ncbi:MAG: sulfotransferase [Gemmatimonadota bacterium]|nr:sulfotransferase [Gemmatimonadota bacterium]
MAKMNQKSETLPAMPFIIGMPFSGTTLLRLMLDAHPDVAIPPGTRFVPHVAQLDTRAQLDKHLFANVIFSVPTWPDLQIPNSLLLDELNKMPVFSAAAAIRLVYRIYSSRFQKTRSGDKTPGYAYSINIISRLLPEAYFIHVIRDGRDVALASLAHHSWHRFGSMTAHATEWKRRIHASWHAALQCPRFVDIKYEDLVTDTESVLRRLCAAIDLPFTDKMLTCHLTADERMAELQDCNQPNGLLAREERLRGYELLSKPPQASEIGRWRNELGRSAIEEYEQTAGDLLAGLGYEVRAT